MAPLERKDCDMTEQTMDRIGAIFDADNHYWEASDAFTRHRDPKFMDRGLRVMEKDGKLRYYFGEKPHPILPGPGDAHGRPVPGSLPPIPNGSTATPV